MIRAFLAVELSEELRSRLAQVQQDVRTRLSRSFLKTIRISWVHPASIHLTIKFLGDLDESVIEPLRVAITQVMEGHRTIQIPLERLGVFPRPQQPRVLWVGPSASWDQGDDAKRLAALHQAVEACCHSFGFAPEGRPLSPHLTLARIKEGEREFGQVLVRSGVAEHSMGIGTLRVSSVVLMRSDLLPTGPVYTKLWEAG
ncbi:MAG: RNA 2',3'-cyclic phosphodiesterase [Nitrospira sp.]|nr:RNA 2',3'-cyclic phosphodiesterase [Nitrospira sp.]